MCSFLTMLFLMACGSGGGGTSSYSEGSLSLDLTDATTNDYNAVYVTIEEVSVCLDDENDEEEGSWLVVAQPETTYNLLELVNGVQEQLGLTDLEEGQYTQMRLIIGSTPDNGTNILGEAHPYANYVVDDADVYHELKIPSGAETGIKLVSGFDIYGGQTTELILDFDASHSVVKAGNSGNWLLKPTIKVVGSTIATISGNVSDSGSGVLEGGLVSAQVYDSEGDNVIVQAATVTDENGNYVLFVEPGAYNLVVCLEGYDPQCGYIETGSNTDYADENFVLTSTSASGTLSGQVSVATELEDPYVSISVRQSTQCQAEVETKIEVASSSVADGESYSFDLPAGTYEVVAETEGYEPQIHAVDVTDGVTSELDITFESAL